MNEILIRRAEWSDREKIFDFYRLAYPDWERRIPERWDWQITHNPFRTVDSPPVWLALDEDDHVIGQTMAMFEPMQIHGKEVLNGWSVDSFVLEPYRGMGIGRRLRERMNPDVSQIMSIMMSAATRHIYQTQGFMALPPLEIYLLSADAENMRESLVVRSHGWIRKVLNALKAGSLFAWYVNHVTARRRRAALSNTSNLDFREVQDFPLQVDDLWPQLRGFFEGAVIRSTQYLNWKYISQPHIDYRIFLIYEEHRLVGYLVLRQGKSRGFVVDFLLDPEKPQLIYQTMDFAISVFKKQGIAEVRAGSAYLPYQNCLRQIGWPKPVDIRVPMVKSTFLANEDVKSWLFGLGDHDMQQ